MLFFCPWFDNFTHFCLEGYPRLYFAIKELKAKNMDFYVVVPPKRREFDTKALYDSFINPILESLNIDKSRRIYTNTYSKLFSPPFIKLHNALIPTHIKCNPTYITEAINHLKQFYYDENFKWEWENVYVSRKKANRRKIANEDSLVTFLAKYNFKEVSMEDLSFKERINILMRTKNLLGIDGTNLTGMIFMPKDSNCIALRCYDMQEFNQFSASIAGINFFCIVCEVDKYIPNHNGESWFFSDLLVNIDYLESKLKEYGII
nr:glycosyltransferase family 61 protein [Helicobacter sp. 16-1353]